MRRAGLLATLLGLVLAAPAGAWFESAAYDVPDGGVAACLRAANPGSVSLLGLRGASAATDLLGVDAHAFTPGATVDGRTYGCGGAAGVDGAEPLLARWQPIRGGRWSDLALHAVSPGGSVATIHVAHGNIVTEPVVALAPGGAAVVVWSEMPLRAYSDELLYGAVRPTAGAPFGPPAQLGSLGGIKQRPGVGIDAAGRATVAWMQARRARSKLAPNLLGTTLEVATATPAGRFGPARRLARSLSGNVALAVAPDGRALLAADVPDVVQAFERLAGASRFARVRLASDGAAFDGLAVALAPDGGAAIAYRNDERSVFAALRPPGGAFRPWETVVPLAHSGDDSFSVTTSSSAPDDTFGRALNAALGANGEVVLSWVDEPRGGRPTAAYAAHGTLVGGMDRPQRLGGPCRSAAGAAPVALAGGGLGVVWADNARTRAITESTLSFGGGRVHLARSGRADGATPASSLPRMSARLVGPPALEPGESLRVRVRCEAACDARVLARARSVAGFDRAFGGGDQAAIWLAASTTLLPGASEVLRLPRLNGFNAAGARGRPRTPIVVSACTPAGPLAQRLELTPPRIADPPPLPRVVDLAAVRHGGAIRVTWRTVAPATRSRFFVGTSPGYRRTLRSVAGRGRSRFAVTLHPGDRRVRRVLVYLVSPATSFGPEVSAPVR